MKHDKQDPKHPNKDTTQHQDPHQTQTTKHTTEKTQPNQPYNKPHTTQTQSPQKHEQDRKTGKPNY